MRHLKKINIDQLTEVERIKLQGYLETLPDSAVVDPSRAAILLGTSERTLARYRGLSSEDGGMGPPYIKMPGDLTSSGKASNRKVTYKVGDLRQWRDGFRVTNTLADLARRSTHLMNFDDVYRQIPFWYDSLSSLCIGPVLDLEAPYEFSMFIQAPNDNVKVRWMPMIKAIEHNWGFSEKRRSDFRQQIRVQMLRKAACV